jgi:hypothetical protein
MNNFCLCSFLTKSALVRHSLEPPCETHTAGHNSEGAGTTPTAVAPPRYPENI